MMKLRNSLKSKIAITLLLMLFTFTFILLFSVSYISKLKIQNFIYNNINSSQNQTYNGFSMVLDEVNLLYSRMVLNDQFHNVLESESLSTTQKEDLYEGVISDVGGNTTLFGDVVVYFGNGVYRSGDESIPLPSKQFVNEVMGTKQLIEQGKIVQNRSGNNYLIIAKRMVNFPMGDVTGVVLFYVNEQVLNEFTSSISTDLGYSLVISDNTYVISNSTGENIGASLFDAQMFTIKSYPNYEVRNINGEKSIIIVNKNKEFNRRYHFDWKIVSVISYDTLYRDILKLNRFNVILGIIMAILAAIVSLRLSVGIIHPIKRIITGLRNFSVKGEKEPFAMSKPNDELWELEKTYDEMISRITELIEKNKEEMEKQRKLELYSLQMQINPHFLYNTLDAIAWMAKIKKQPDIEKLVIALAKFFRISLHKGDKFITVEEEIELVKNFIKIELIRFPDKFTIEYDIDETVKHEDTLKLLLQPIVENAIKHGISQTDECGHIIIKAYGKDDELYFEVMDNGLGFKVEDDVLTKHNHDHPGGYGLKNVNERIHLEYGDDCYLKVTSKPNDGTKVVIKIKKRNK